MKIFEFIVADHPSLPLVRKLATAPSNVLIEESETDAVYVVVLGCDENRIAVEDYKTLKERLEKCFKDVQGGKAKQWLILLTEYLSF